MDIEKEARNYFLGKNGYKRLNCAQTIALLFKDRISLITDETVLQFKKKGYGKAPSGECGMLFAAKYIFKEEGLLDEVERIDTFFREIAGTTSCKELKKKKIPFCAECLVKTAQYVDEILSDSRPRISKESLA